MRTGSIFASLGFGFALACSGGNAASPSAADSNASAVSDSATESSELAASFAQESSGVTAYRAVPRGDKDTAPTARAELVVALEAIAADPSLCVSGSATLTPVGNQTSSCASIGNNGSYPGGATLQLNACTLAGGGMLNGTAAITVTRALSAGATCGPTASIDVTHQVSLTNLAYTSATGDVITYPTFSATVVSTHPIGAAPTLLTLTSLSGERTIHGPAGLLLQDHQLSGSGTVALSASPITRTINATITVVHELLHFTAQVVITNLVRVETCCKPVGGTVEITLTSNTSGASIGPGTFTYGPSCGQVDLDGELLGVAECL